MPNKHNDERHHHISKMKFRVTNWSAYEAGLRRRGSLTLWVSDDVIAAWRAPSRKTPGEPAAPSSIEQAEVAAVLRAAGHQGDDKPAAPGSGKEDGAQLSAGSCEAAPADPAVAAPSSSAPGGIGADAEIARLQAHVEDLRRENGMLWDQVKHEREARIREIELLNGMIPAMRR
jgi:hypothetical protein